MILYPLIGAALFALLFRYFFKRRIAQRFDAPFELAAEDPQLESAIQEARSRLDEFRELFAQRPKDTYVKISYRGDRGEIQHLWGLLLELSKNTMKMKPENLSPRYHGPLEEDQDRPLADLEDWQVVLPDGKIRGGFTLKVMFLKAREQCESIPEELLKSKDRYVDH